MVDSAGQPEFTIHRPAAYDFPELTEADLQALSSQQPDWIYFGTANQMSSHAKALTRRLIESNPGARRFYDVNLRVNSYEKSLVHELMKLATVVKMNQEEVTLLGQLFGSSARSLEDFCRSYVSLFSWEGVCVTRGQEGCALLIGGEYVESPGYSVRVADTVGAGDAFAAAFLHGLSCRWSALEIADFANRVGALVASREGAVPAWAIKEVKAFPKQSGEGLAGGMPRGYQE